MSKGIIIQPHWHTNVTEMVFVISGEVITSVFNPFTQKLMTYQLKPGQVCMLPKGWFHWIVAQTDHVHLLTIFDQPTPDIVYGSDFLRFTPKEVMNRAYCVDENDYAKAVAPLQESIILGPPLDCVKGASNIKMETLRNVEPWVQTGLRDGQGMPVEYTLRETAAISYLIGKGYNSTAAHQIVESWQ
ncbi:cupin domain-containing protein [Paenibacillus sp. N3.4]|uniref:cupin domain-containing protein n=1 Tax=Paenibacillus sp. N3.4 TaxID=2603222 RepID=UPI0011C85F94|nr:cupin domain-containing protein [Paenibacillus sp. N3.4]TXK85180.1 cupin domain-containing protein [Paenibacillus sp. N3.4]